MMTFEEILHTIEPVEPGWAAILKANAEERIFHRRDLLITQGEKCDSVYFIKVGLARSYFLSEEIEETNMFAIEGDIITSMTSFVNDKEAIFSLEALTDMIVYCVSFSAIKKLMMEDCGFQTWVIGLLAGQLAALETRFPYRGGGYSAYRRYSEFMSRRASKYMRLIPLKYIAQYLHMTPQTLSKIRRMAAGKK